MSPAKIIRPKEWPFYVHMPSVRPMVTKTLAFWFVHAIEAKIGESELEKVLNEILREKEKAQEKAKPDLGAIAKALTQRKGSEGAKKAAFNGDIHFVVVDNAEFHLEKPSEQLHTPVALKFAASLNRIGNKRGVYVHYITPKEFAELLPEKFYDHTVIPYAHKTQEGKIRVSPGEGTNIALAYISAFHERKYGGTAFLMRASDDVFPSTNKVSLPVNEPYLGFTPLLNAEHRNFFADSLKAFEGKLSTTGGYSGYEDNTRNTVRNGRSHFISRFVVRVASPLKLPFYNARYNEDIDYVGRRLPNFFAPGYLFHAGRTTYKKTGEGWAEYFGEYHNSDLPVPVSEKFVRKVVSRSRLKLSGIAKKE